MKRIFKLLLRVITRPYDTFLCKIDPAAFAKKRGVSVGKNVRFIGLSPNGEQFGSEPYLIEIGDNVTITAKVQFVNHDGGLHVFRNEHKDLNKYGRIKIGNNCFVGVRSIILPGVSIGDNCVVGAGSIVTKDIASGSVVAGVPAKVICSTKDYYEKNRTAFINKEFISELEKRAYLDRHI